MISLAIYRRVAVCAVRRPDELTEIIPELADRCSSAALSRLLAVAGQAMPEMLDQLGDEHRNIARLLSVMERQLAIFERGDRPDYDVLTAVADYFVGFPDRCHHPKEDMILRLLRTRYPAAADTVGDLDTEHSEIGALAVRFRDAIYNVVGGAEIARDAFASVLREFIDAQRQHMKMEQERFFPVVNDVLTPGDWAELRAAAGDDTDPVFGSQADEKFESLRQKIMRWQAQDEAESR